MRTVLYTFIILAFALSVGAVQAQTEPEMPRPLAEAVAGGAQIYYLGEFEGLNGWALIRQGQPEFYYANKSNTALMMGLLFDGDGEMITNGQLAQLQYKEGDNMFAITGTVPTSEKSEATVENNAPATAPAPVTAVPQPSSAPTESLTRDPSSVQALTPAQEMFVDIRASNWFTMGERGMYEIFAFVDPDCVHCQAFIRDMEEPFLKEGYIKIRVIPIGFNAASAGKAAMLLASANPEERLIAYSKGNTDVLNAPSNINTAAVDSNRALMRKWGFDATPTIIYRAGNGEIRFIRGKPDDYSAMIQDLLATQ